MIPNCNPICHACRYKEDSYETQLEKKQLWAEQQLENWNHCLQRIIPAPLSERLAYRSKSWMRCEFRDAEPYFPQGSGQINFGMIRSRFNLGRWEKEFVSWNDCPLHIHSIGKVIRKIQSEFLPQYYPRMKESWVGLWFGPPHLVLVSSQPSLEETRSMPWDKIIEPPFDRVWFHQNSQVGKKIFGHHPLHGIAGPTSDSAHPIRAFRQVAQTLLVDARNRGTQALLENAPSLVLDLYCGTGELSLLIPSKTSWIGIESSHSAVEYANTLGEQRTGIHQAFAGLVEERLNDPRVLQKIQGDWNLWINPPRSGISQDAQQRLLNLFLSNPPNRIVYLSCSASSLKRDLEVLEKAGFKIQSLQPFDFFPQTEHFETLAVLAR